MDAVCGLAAETKVETPEGGLAIRTANEGSARHG